MRCTREKIIAAVPSDAVALLEQGDVAGLGDGIAAEIEDARRQLLQQCRNNVEMQAGARRVDDDDFLACNVVEGLFAGSEDGAGVGTKFGDVALHFADSIGVDFHQRDVAGANGQADGADARVEVEGRLARLANIFLFRPARRQLIQLALLARLCRKGKAFRKRV